MNNYILIKQLKGERYQVTDRDMDTNEVLGRRYTVNGLRRAILKAQTMESEYGISFLLEEMSLER